MPQAAIGTDQGRKFLLVVDDKNVVEERVVELGSQQSGGLQAVIPVKMVRTSEGLRRADPDAPSSEPTIDSVAASDQVIVGGLQRVRPGMTVKTREAESDAASTDAMVPISAAPSPTQSPSGTSQ